MAYTYVYMHENSFLKKQRKKEWSWTCGKVRRIWDNRKEIKQNILHEFLTKRKRKVK